MPTKVTQIEERLAHLEKEVRDLKAELRHQRVPWYEQIAGTFENDPVFDEIVRLGAAIRKADRNGRR